MTKPMAKRLELGFTVKTDENDKEEHRDPSCKARRQR